MMYSFERRLAFPTADFANLSKRDGIIRAASVTLPPDAAKAEAYFERALVVATPRRGLFARRAASLRVRQVLWSASASDQFNFCLHHSLDHAGQVFVQPRLQHGAKRFADYVL
jgi:hypothetical protein